jgi:hypothetical protein
MRKAKAGNNLYGFFQNTASIKKGNLNMQQNPSDTTWTGLWEESFKNPITQAEAAKDVAKDLLEGETGLSAIAKAKWKNAMHSIAATSRIENEMSYFATMEKVKALAAQKAITNELLSSASQASIKSGLAKTMRYGGGALKVGSDITTEAIDYQQYKLGKPGAAKAMFVDGAGIAGGFAGGFFGLGAVITEEISAPIISTPIALVTEVASISTGEATFKQRASIFYDSLHEEALKGNIPASLNKYLR